MEEFQQQLADMFQYISCYSLSYASIVSRTSKPRFNTSHVTLYRRCNRRYCHKKFCFNTSHVTLYRYKWMLFYAGWIVSIHLMLLFIIIGLALALWKKMFQYISCYSLSQMWCCWTTGHLRFNTSHVTLYLLLRKMKQLGKTSFNTSHVTLYHDPHVRLQVSDRRFNTSHVTLYREFAIFYQ